jgi:hypothetical protein
MKELCVLVCLNEEYFWVNNITRILNSNNRIEKWEGEVIYDCYGYKKGDNVSFIGCNINDFEYS